MSTLATTRLDLEDGEWRLKVMRWGGRVIGRRPAKPGDDAVTVYQEMRAEFADQLQPVRRQRRQAS